MTTSRRDIGVAIGIPEPYTTELQGWRERHLQVIAESFPHHVVRREVPGVGVLAVRDFPFGAPLPGPALPPGLLG